ncbi:hypothetical protein [Leptospira santarosai]|uniref:hypothetical protein n=1 Tax=Leptospira santarosai TaxID=28183 RepID=UPI0024AFE5EE|nr:hypothetical protein [Leptospira santarosai]MDI7172672.1 hypothetical protein [Leptospira santarosai]MDI7194620.1 hypothetical protein [Leptospira santarosai]MDO6396723.1 hypothetical protein [Leptospira santarosai]MDO6404462.1 hypothetical protein [Leptospira santarosai]
MLCIFKITRFVLVTNPKPTVGITESAFYSSLRRYRFKKTMLGTIKQYKTRLSATVAILGIAATALSYCSKSSFGYSARRTIPKLTLFFTNPIKAIGRLRSEPIPESIHITPAWEVAADIKITLEVAEFIENDDFSKRTNLEQTEEDSHPKAKLENLLKQDAIQEILELEFPTRNPNKKDRSISTKSLELDEIQKIRNTKTELPDDPKQSYLQEADGSLTEGIQVEKEILNLNPNLEKVQPRLRNGKLRNETIGSLRNTFEIHDAPSDPILIKGSVVDLKTLDLTSLYSVPWEWETDTFEIRILENMNIDRWVWEHIQETFQEVRTVNLETSFPSLSESAKERLLYLPRRDQTRKNPHELARESVYKNTDSKGSSFKTDLPRFPSLRIDRKQMRYYAIQINGPPPTDHKQV